MPYYRNDYKIFAQLMLVLELLRYTREGLTYDDIILHIYEDLGHKEPSRKTVERLLKFIKYKWPKHFKVSKDTLSGCKRYRLENWYGQFPINDVNSKEMQALNAAIKKTTNAPLKEQLRNLEYKLQTQGKYKNLLSLQEITTSVRGPEPVIKQDAEIEKTLKDAALNRFQVEIVYKKRTKTPTHTISPLGLVYGNTNNYLVAYDAGANNQIKNFILGDIRQATCNNLHFAKPKDFSISEYAQRSFGLYHSPHGPFDVEWRVIPESAKDALRFQFHPTQTTTKNPDGSLTIKFRADGLYEMAMYLFQWGGKIIPVAPAELREVYQNCLDQCAASLK